jgi:hypothetical protein
MREATRRGTKRKVGQIEESHSMQTSQAKRPKRDDFGKRKPQVCECCGVPGHPATSCWMNPKSKKFRPEFAQRMFKLAEEAQKSAGQVVGSNATPVSDH